MDVGPHGGNDRIGVSTLTIDHLAVFFQTHGCACLRIGAFGDGADREQGQTRIVREGAADGVEGCIDRTVAVGGRFHGFTVDFQNQRCFRRALRTGHDIQRQEADAGVIDRDGPWSGLLPCRNDLTMKHWSLASRIVSGTLIVVLGALVLLSVLVAAFTRYEVTERLDNSLQEVAERLEFVIGELDKSSQGSVTPGGQVARLPGVNRRTLAYQIAATDGQLEVRSQNAPETLFVPHLETGFYNLPEFRVYIAPSLSGHHYILVGEPTFHRNEAVRRAILISVLPMVIDHWP